ncbi:MAG: secondary thiamine-phosphate synthase enzyme YjbQ [Thermodesulfobacteriota bacterium]
MESLDVRSRSRVEFLDITSKVRDVISRSGVRDGIAVVYVPHTTAAVTINESADPAVAKDIMNKLSELVPENGSYRHVEGNSDAHIKSTLVGNSVNLVVSQGSPVFGTWQGVFFCEFDGPRNRKVIVQVVPTK